MKVEDIETGQRLRVTVEGIVIETAYQEIHFEGHSLVIIGDKDDTTIEKVRFALPTTVGTVLRTIYKPTPYIVKYSYNEWRTFGGNSFTNAEVQLRWDEGEYEEF